MTKSSPDLSPFCLRARNFLSQGRIDDALGLYADVLQVDPENAMAYADRGTAYAMLKKFDLAQADLEHAIALGHVDASTYSTLGTLCFELKDYAKALVYFDKAIELDPKYPFTYYNRSNVYHELGNTQAAISDLEKCLTFEPAEDFKQLISRRLNALRKA